jgi:hypothetical protein
MISRLTTRSLHRWSIKAPDKTKPVMTRFKTRENEQNGSRTFQLIMKKMQVLPMADITKSFLCSTLPVKKTSEKRKASMDYSAGKKMHMDTESLGGEQFDM